MTMTMTLAGPRFHASVGALRIAVQHDACQAKPIEGTARMSAPVMVGILTGMSDLLSRDYERMIDLAVALHSLTGATH